METWKKRGTDPLLCFEDADEFIHIIFEHAEESDALYTSQVLFLAQQLIEKRSEIVKQFLDNLHCTRLPNNYLCIKHNFSRSWLFHFCDIHGLNIKTAEAMDSDRIKKRTGSTEHLQTKLFQRKIFKQSTKCMILSINH
jgi:hypothetical protein